MRGYIIRRLLLILPILFILSILVFLSVRFIPGDVIDVMQGGLGSLWRVDREALEQIPGLDVPAWVRYGRWMTGILRHGTLGNSLMEDWLVEEKILEGRRNMEQAPWLALWPGLFLTIVVYSFNIFGDAVRDLLDPRLRGGEDRYDTVVVKRKRSLLVPLINLFT